MSLEFPRFVFKNGGLHERPNGRYSYLLVENENEYERALKDGWFATVPEATEGKKRLKR